MFRATSACTRAAPNICHTLHLKLGDEITSMVLNLEVPSVSGLDCVCVVLRLDAGALE
jgi:hypothetical protein